MSFYPVTSATTTIRLMEFRFSRSVKANTSHGLLDSYSSTSYSEGIDHHVIRYREYLLRNLNDPCYRLISNQYKLKVETFNDYVMASDDYLHLYGIGDTTDDAILEYSSMLIDYYTELTSSECELSEYLRDKLEYLNSILERR